jgi:hypothetical protein
VYARKLPYEGEKLVKVLHDLKIPDINKRPPVPASCPDKIGNLMKDCLLEDPALRPSFEEIDLMLQRLSVENVEPGELHLSAYARKELKAKRANNLLFDVFPPHIAEALRDGRKVEAESHDCGKVDVCTAAKRFLTNDVRILHHHRLKLWQLPYFSRILLGQYCPGEGHN